MIDVISSVSETSAALTDTADRVREYAEHSRADNTRRAYAADWRDFTAWCTTNVLHSLPAAPATVALYIADLAERCKVATIERRLAALSQAHQLAGYPSPTKDEYVRTVLKGIRRVAAERGIRQRQAAPAVTQVIRAMVATLDSDPCGIRDRALLVLGFAGAFRRSEIVSLDVADLAFTQDGLVVKLRRSKTDQEGRCETKGIPYGSNPATCPVRAVRAWLDTTELTHGALFRPIDRWGNISPARLSDRAVTLVIKRAAERAGLDPIAFSGHSLRAGLATAAAAAGAAYHSIKKQTGHKSDRVLQGYIREGSLFRDNAAAQVGL